MSTPFFDVIAGSDGESQKLGRAWLVEKDGKSRMSIEMSSMPLPYQVVHLVNTEKHPVADCRDFVLKAPIEREGKKTYWHPVGEIQKDPSGDYAFRVLFASIPLSGSLSAFEKDN